MTILAIAAFGSAIAGCGGSSKASTSSSTASGAGATSSSNTASTSAASSTSTTGRPPASSATFVAAADAVCRRYNDEIIALGAKTASAAEIKRIVPPTIAIEHATIRSMRALKPPASLATDWQRMIGFRQRLVDELGSLLADASKDNSAVEKSLATAKGEVHTELTKTATAHGFKDCGKVGSVG
jgi:hypothetical protein